MLQLPQPYGRTNMKTDSQLQQDVIAELKWEPSVNAAQIGVEVSGGVVTLAGHVDSFTAKWNAERAAQRVAGVKAMAIEIDVNLPGASKRNDGDIARSVQNVLQWTTYLGKDAIKVSVQGGSVTLTGQVDWEYQRRAAVNAVRYLLGVTGIIDHITLHSSVSLSTVKTDIEAALKRQAMKDAQNISVAVSGGDITLSGTVHSWAEREMARNSAWATPGVHSVVDHMTVVV